MERTTVSVRRDTAERLHDKKRYGDSMDDVIRRLLGDEVEAGETPDARTNTPTDPTNEAKVVLGDDLPSGVDEEDAREAVAAVMLFISEQPAEFSEIAEEVGREFALGYSVEQVELRDGAWWKRIVKPSIKANGAEHHAGRGWTVDR
jgi:hypothetical protein